jgi:hypothetical protein
MKKQHNLIFLGLFLVFTIFLINFSSAELSYCCEKTTTTSSSGGAWCQNAPAEDCNTQYKKAPTSCESTSYCKLGTCIDSQEGTCSENTPQVVCENNGGVWSDQPMENLGQCQLGCCAIGDQTAYVTQTRCKRLSSLYGLETNYRTDINSELECIITSQPDAKGACVFTREYERTCLMTSKKECQEFEASADKEDIEFFEGTLCSDETLGTNCGPSKKTTCTNTDDSVYFLDTCGNIANIYDSSKIADKKYWSTIYEKDEICGYNSLNGNADSKSCGNCDYYYGSTCKDYTILDNSARPDIGNYVCADLSCEYDGETYEHGETWCGTNNEGKASGYNVPGTNHYRYVCYNGEVTVEPCADYRQEYCVEEEIEIEGYDPYSVAACVVNRWQNCFNQDNSEDCTNSDERDCTWVEGRRFDGEERDEEDEQGYCIPSITPGFDFWQGDTSAKDTCGLVSETCTVTYVDKLLSKEKIESGAECLDKKWKEDHESMCITLGDCGYSVNYLGNYGYNHSSYNIGGIEDEKE